MCLRFTSTPVVLPWCGVLTHLACLPAWVVQHQGRVQVVQLGGTGNQEVSHVGVGISAILGSISLGRGYLKQKHDKMM